MPFQALRDFFPVGHPNRRYVLNVQMTFILSQCILLPAAIVASVSAAIVGKVLFVVLIFAYLVLGFYALSDGDSHCRRPSQRPEHGRLTIKLTDHFETPNVCWRSPMSPTPTRSCQSVEKLTGMARDGIRAVCTSSTTIDWRLGCAGVVSPAASS